MSLEPLKPFRTIVEVIVKRKTGGGRWRYEVNVEATDAPPDDTISLRASVGGVSSAVFRLCNRYLGYAPFQVSQVGVTTASSYILRVLSVLGGAGNSLSSSTCSFASLYIRYHHLESLTQCRTIAFS